MDIRKKLQRDIEKQKQKIIELQAVLNSEESYLRAQMDLLKMFPREPGATSDLSLRPGSDPARVRDILKEAGRPLHISDILEKLGKPMTVEARSGLSGTLGTYVRRGEIFRRPGPNTFGLINPDQEEEEAVDQLEPPEDFGK
jgi:hypothetical protein